MVRMVSRNVQKWLYSASAVIKKIGVCGRTTDPSGKASIFTGKCPRVLILANISLGNSYSCSPG